MSRFTSDELRQAIVALNVIEAQGDSGEWAYILQQAQQSTPSGDQWGNATYSQRLGGQMLADRLAGLLGEPRERCEQAAAEVFAPQRHRTVYDAILNYAAELAGASSPTTSTAAPVPTERPSIRIVADNREGAA